MTSSVAAALVSVVATGQDLEPVPGATGTIGLALTGGGDGDLKVRVRLVDGRPVEASADGGPEPDLTLSLPVADAGAVATGALEASVAFMRGRLKTAGDNGLLLGVLAATAAPGFAPWIAGIAAGP